jgi:hypothetical protein
MYIEEMESLQRSSPLDLRTVYVSYGNQTWIQKFRDMATPLGYTVQDKWSLLSGDLETLARVDNLMFDEKAVVEYQMLLNADFFVGQLCRQCLH